VRPTKYQRVRERLRGDAGRLGAHNPVASETELMRSHKVSRATARRAIADLVHEGVLYTRQGRGTFVAPARVLTGLDRPAGFTEAMAALGRAPASRVLSVAGETATPDQAAALRVKVGAALHVIDRLRLLDGEPCMIERARVPVERAPGLETHDLSGSLYAVLEREYGLVAAGGHEVVLAENADRDSARLLDVPLASALLVTVRTTVDAGGAPFEHTDRRARGDLCSFRVSLDRESGLADRA
jgi:GntR family transcriptional regulator